ncbi:MAG: DUF2313 domain-containing protein [Lachnospiraceae bacterium]|nr:DUF2313 domain-containing protein [Lachnospiraceae bacterium]
MGYDVELLSYLPAFLQDTEEFKGIFAAENPEFSVLYGAEDALMDNGFIHTADLQGIRRWEQLLGLEGATKDLSSRRANVLAAWNRTVPYTMARLYEYLDALADRKDYHIRVSEEECSLELLVEDLPGGTIWAMHDLVRVMLPANMVFILANRIPWEAIVSCRTDASMRVLGSFWARCNVMPNLLDGTTFLDGAYCLDGSISGQGIDFYPVVLRIIAGAEWRTERAGTAVTSLLFRPEIPIEIKNDAALRIWGAARAKTQAINRFFLYGSVHKKIQNGSQLVMQGIVKEHMDTEASPQFIAETEVEIAQESALQAEGFVDCGVKTDGTLIVEKDLWRLDGSVMLDGSRILDAEIYEEKI